MPLRRDAYRRECRRRDSRRRLSLHALRRSLRRYWHADGRQMIARRFPRTVDFTRQLADFTASWPSRFHSRVATCAYTIIRI